MKHVRFPENDEQRLIATIESTSCSFAAGGITSRRARFQNLAPGERSAVKDHRIKWGRDDAYGSKDRGPAKPVTTRC